MLVGHGKQALSEGGRGRRGGQTPWPVRRWSLAARCLCGPSSSPAISANGRHGGVHRHIREASGNGRLGLIGRLICQHDGAIGSRLDVLQSIGQRLLVGKTPSRAEWSESGPARLHFGVTFAATPDSGFRSGVEREPGQRERPGRGADDLDVVRIDEIDPVDLIRDVCEDRAEADILHRRYVDRLVQEGIVVSVDRDCRRHAVAAERFGIDQERDLMLLGGKLQHFLERDVLERILERGALEQLVGQFVAIVRRGRLSTGFTATAGAGTAA